MVGPGLSIRSASVADLEELVPFSIATYVAAFGASFQPDDLAAHLVASLSPAQWQQYLDNDRVLLAIETEKIAGFVQFGATTTPGIVELRRLYVDPARQGQGIGSALLEAALADSVLADAQCVELDVWEHNPGASRLYQRYGFMPAGRRAFRNPAGEITGYDIIMRRYAQRQ